MTTFNAEQYAFSIAHWPNKVKKSERPVTLADYEEAERQARELILCRLSNGPDDDTLPEISEIEADDGSARLCADTIRDWGQDVVDEATGWERVAQDLLDFKAKLAKAKLKKAA
jgi:hypothetical protein